MNQEPQKVCTRCKKSKTLDNFYKTNYNTLLKTCNKCLADKERKRARAERERERDIAAKMLRIRFSK